ncbi:HAD-like protein [Auriscalpium vulgare]|uniref:HAD-like protein n=1 Tax=Auriscalpium vulgare TaxID=40419 RepID=A0ACB8RR20_9AGAM|nr:HAD-like protein [Auriscalpium vulgare]
MGVFALGVGAGAVWLGREWTDDELAEKRMLRDSAPATRWGRTAERFTSMFDYFSKPIWPELLPPPLPAPHQKPYTLLVSLDDLLVTSTWDRQHGWRTAKRPGVDYFLAYLSQFFEVVIFTTQHHYTAIPILEKLDPYNFFITYKLFRDATRASEGGPVKDLSYLNRPLDKVLIIDAHAEHVASHPENAIVVKPWKGTKENDRGLIDLIPFLESIGIYKPPDVRSVLKSYEGKDIPKEYAIKEAEHKKVFIEQWRARGGGKGLSSGGFTISSLFSSGPEKAAPLPLTYLEAKRKEAQSVYLEEKKYIEEHKAEFEKLIEADRQAQMTGPIWSNIAAGFGVAPPTPPPGTLEAGGEKAPEGSQQA